MKWSRTCLRNRRKRRLWWLGLAVFLASPPFVDAAGKSRPSRNYRGDKGDKRKTAANGDKKVLPSGNEMIAYRKISHIVQTLQEELIEPDATVAQAVDTFNEHMSWLGRILHVTHDPDSDHGHGYALLDRGVRRSSSDGSRSYVGGRRQRNQLLEALFGQVSKDIRMLEQKGLPHDIELFVGNAHFALEHNLSLLTAEDSFFADALGKVLREQIRYLQRVVSASLLKKALQHDAVIEVAAWLGQLDSEIDHEATARGIVFENIDTSKAVTKARKNTTQQRAKQLE